MAFNINGVDLKKFNVNIGDTTHAVKRFDVVKDGVTTTVWRDILDIYPNSDITWTVERSPVDSDEENNSPGKFSVGRGGEGKERKGWCRSSGIDVSDYETIIWKGECLRGGSGAITYGNVGIYLYGSTIEAGKDDFFKIILLEKGSTPNYGTNKTFYETIDVTDIDTLYLTIEIQFESTNDQGGWQNVFTESIIAKNE